MCNREWNTHLCTPLGCAVHGLPSRVAQNMAYPILVHCTPRGTEMGEVFTFAQKVVKYHGSENVTVDLMLLNCIFDTGISP